MLVVYSTLNRILILMGRFYLCLIETLSFTFAKKKQIFLMLGYHTFVTKKE